MQTLKHKRGHRLPRAQEYPFHGEALDAMREGWRALQEQGMTLPPKLVEYLDSCDEIKKKYPKPKE